MRNRKATKLLLGLLTTLSVSIASAQTAFVAGPVEHMSIDSGQITVLGQTYVVDAETVFGTAGKIALRTVGAGELHVGDFVAIEATTTSVPLRATSLAPINTQYVPGASSVFLGGTVEQVSIEFATLKIGGLAIDISQASPEVLSTVQVGSFAQIAGIQPSPSGSLLGQQIQITPMTRSIGGTGGRASLQSIGGTGGKASLQSIGGTGGASLQSIGGTGGRASLQSIGGTGGTSLQSIGGTGGVTSL